MALVELADIRHCLEGAVPSIIATCDDAGVPNLSFVSQVHYLDARHVALTFQFFNKTYSNIRENPQATVYVTDPETAAQYRLILMFRESQTEGPLFNALKAKLSGIAAHTGMSGVFRLRGVDIYQVIDIHCVVAGDASLAPARHYHLAALREIFTLLSSCQDLGALFDATLLAVCKHLGIGQAALLMLDERGDTLYTVSSRGFKVSGVGAEVPLGYGIIGLCAAEKLPIRIAFGASEYSYRNAIVHFSRDADSAGRLETAIPFPELSAPSSQLAVPVCMDGRLLGVLYVESETRRRFGYEDEDALMLVAQQLAARHALLACAESQDADAVELPEDGVPVRDGHPLRVRYYPANHSVFLDNDYLIKGVAGAILWRILQQWQDKGREHFSNRELRLDPHLGLPEISDNLEARLILLQKRLVERSAPVRIEKTGRGRFALRLARPVQLTCETE